MNNLLDILTTRLIKSPADMVGKKILNTRQHHDHRLYLVFDDNTFAIITAEQEFHSGNYLEFSAAVCYYDLTALVIIGALSQSDKLAWDSLQAESKKITTEEKELAELARLKAKYE